MPPTPAALTNKSTDTETIGLITNWFVESRDWLQPLHWRWDRLYAQFRNFLQLDDTWMWQSRVAIPEAFTIIWTLLPTILESMLAQPPYIKVRPLRPDTVEGSKFAENLLDIQLKRIGHNSQGVYMTMLKVWQDCLLYGNGFYDLMWRFDEGIQRRKVPRFNDEPMLIDLAEVAPNLFGVPEGGQIEMPPGSIFLGDEIVEGVNTVYDDPDINIVNNKDVFPDPWGLGVQGPSSRYIITRDTWTEAQGASFEDDPGYKNIDKIQFTETGFGVTDPQLVDHRRDIDEVNWGIAHSGNGGEFSEILKCQYTRKDGKHWREWWTIISGRHNIIFDGPNPYFHEQRTIIKADCFSLPHRFHDTGALEPVEDLNDGINQGYNQARDVVTMKLNPMFEVTPNMYDDLDDEFQGSLPPIPGLMLRKPTSQDDISSINFSGDIQPAGQDLTFLSEKRKVATGTSDVVSGALPTQRKETATAIASAESRASSRHRTLMKTLWFTSFRPLADRIISMNHQFKDVREFVQIPGSSEEFIEISMENIPWDGMAFEPNMTFISGITKEIKARQFQDLIAILASTPLAARFKWEEIWQMLADFNDLPEAQKALMSEEEFQAAQEQELALALAQQGQGGGGQQVLPDVNSGAQLALPNFIGGV
jgi:hypothetical protein